jgi:hypothetical protein
MHANKLTYTTFAQAIALGVEHGMIIGLEEDRQGLLNKRLDSEKAETLAQVCMYVCMF